MFVRSAMPPIAILPIAKPMRPTELISAIDPRDQPNSMFQRNKKHRKAIDQLAHGNGEHRSRGKDNDPTIGWLVIAFASNIHEITLI